LREQRRPSACYEGLGETLKEKNVKLMSRVPFRSQRGLNRRKKGQLVLVGGRSSSSGIIPRTTASLGGTGQQGGNPERENIAHTVSEKKSGRKVRGQPKAVTRGGYLSQQGGIQNIAEIRFRERDTNSEWRSSG